MSLGASRIVALFVVCSLAVLGACDVEDDTPGDGDGGGSETGTPDLDADRDGAVGPDGGPVFPDAGDSGPDTYVPPIPVDPCNPVCGEVELCGETNDGDGVDNDCNDDVDETCSCTPNTTRPCFAGPPDRRGRGACADGIETCDEFGTWGECAGGISPRPEACDGVDNDCNGMADEGLSGCSSSVICPTAQGAAPLSNFPLRGGIVYDGDARTWMWTVSCPSTVPDGMCPLPATPTEKNTSVYFVQSGAYRVTLDVETTGGEDLTCTWTVYVQGSGLRVELNWDTQGSDHGDTDVDLHLHRWTRNGMDTEFFNDDDCYYANCKASTHGFGGRSIDWRDSPRAGDHADNSDVAVCADAPHGEGADWLDLGACYNPRLDVDVITCESGEVDPTAYGFCAPENINVDEPVPGVPYRVMVNYFGDHGHTGPTTPAVNIYCGGALRGSFGLDPLVQLTRSGGSSGQNWMVADVVFFVGVCGVDCMVYPLGSIIDGPAFGPAWSCDADVDRGVCTPRP